jgi:hypothetical protein
MKHIKTFEDFINESTTPLNESREDKDVVRAIKLGKIKRDDIVTLAKKTTVPEYAQDYIQAYDRIIDFNNKAKQSKSDIKWMSKDMKEFYMLLDKGVKHNDKTIKALATKIDKALDPYVRESQVDESNEGAVYKGTGKLNPWFNGKIFAILKKAETGYSIQATVDDIVKLDDEFIDAKDEIFDIIEKMKRNHTGIQAVLDNIVHAIQRKYESSAPLSEGKIEDKIIDAIKQEWEEHGNKIYHSKKEYLKSLGIDPKDVDIKHIK